MFNRKSLGLFAAILMMAIGTSANAALINGQLINVNFEAFTGSAPGGFETESALSGPLGGLNTQWNQFADEDSSGVVVDSANLGTTVSFTTNFSESRRGENSNVLPIFNSTLTDFGRSGVSRNLTIAGLEADSLHDIAIVAYRDQNPFNNGQERLKGTWSTTNATTSASSQLLDSATTQSDLAFADGVNFLLFENVQADASGMIVFDAVAEFRIGANPNDNDANDFHRLGLSGFQIQSLIVTVPEPATATLAMIGLGGLVMRRRRNAA